VEASYTLKWPESAFLVEREHNAEFTANFVRVTYSSMITPPSIYDISFDTKVMTLRKEKGAYYHINIQCNALQPHTFLCIR
jgi:protease II